LGTAHVLLEEPEELPRFMGFLPEKTYRQIQQALEAGIRSFELGRMYRSHRPMGHVLGEWFRLGHLERNDVFLTTKVFHGNAERFGTKNSHMHNLESLSPEQVTTDVTKEVEEALVDLGIGYIDLLLLHWPASALGNDVPANLEENRKRRFAAWRVLEDMYEKGWLRAIGVSNFSEEHLKQLQEDGARIVPMVNQIEASLSVEYPRIVNYCKEHGIVLQAFSPLMRGDMSDEINEVAKKYDKTLAQISLRYLYQKGYSSAYLSTNLERMTSNFMIFDFEIAENDMRLLSEMPTESGNWGLPTPYDVV
ncbi:unnamed protein product, partial [Heterosigma akashiwo]